MSTASWLIIAAFFWFAGFLDMKLLEPSPESKLAFVPKWMFLLFGAPKHKDLPLTVQSVWSIYLQTMGITLAFYGIFLDKRLMTETQISGLLGLGISMLLSIIVSQWLYQSKPYVWKREI